MKYIIRKPLLKSLWAVGVISIIVLSVMPAEQMPALDVSDKIEHLLSYAGISFLGFLASSTKMHRIWVALSMIVLGLALEGVQYLLPTRAFEALDGLANTVGVLSALGIYYIYVGMRKKFEG